MEMTVIDKLSDPECQQEASLLDHTSNADPPNNDYLGEEVQGHKVGSCNNCSVKLRAHPWCLFSFSRFPIFFFATGVIQAILLCVCIFDAKIGIHLDEKILPTLDDCGRSESLLRPSIPTLIALIVLNIAQIIVDVWSIAVNFVFARQMQFKNVILRYFFLALSFGGYFTTLVWISALPWWNGQLYPKAWVHTADSHWCALAFSFPGPHGDLFSKNPLNGVELYVAGFYYSTETITSVGYGDVSPHGLIAKCFGACEMMLGMCFSVFIVSGALEKFAQPVHETLANRAKKAQQNLQQARVGKKRLQQAGLSIKVFWFKFRDNVVVSTVRRKARKMHVLVTLVVETLAMVLMALYREDSGAAGWWLVSVVIGMQFFVFAANLAISVKYSRRVNEVSISFLFQSLVCTVVDFGCVYNSMCFLRRDWDGDGLEENNEMPFTACPAFMDDNMTSTNTTRMTMSAPADVFETALNFIYFSFVTITTTGYGSIVPTIWFTRLLVCVEMYLAVLYGTVIFGLGLSRYFDTSPTSTNDPQPSTTDHMPEESESEIAREATRTQIRHRITSSMSKKSLCRELSDDLMSTESSENISEAMSE